MADTPRYCDEWTRAEWCLWIERLASMRSALANGWTFEDAMRHVNMRQFEVHDTTANGPIDWLLAVNNGIVWALEQVAQLECNSAGGSK